MTSILVGLLIVATAFAGGRRNVDSIGADEILPQVIFGGDWKTIITLMSLRETKVTLPLEFYDQQGQPMSAPFSGRTPASKLDVTIEAGGSVTLETDQPSATSVGWGRVDISCPGSISSADCFNVYGTVILRNRAPGRPDYEAVYPLTDDTRRSIIQVDNKDFFETLIFVVNTGTFSFSSPIDVTVAFRDEGGQRVHLDQFRVARASTQFFPLPEKYPQLRNFRGTADFTSPNGSFVVVGLRINPTNAFAGMIGFE